MLRNISEGPQGKQIHARREQVIQRLPFGITVVRHRVRATRLQTRLINGVGDVRCHQ